MGKVVDGVANDYDCEQLEDWNKHLRYCQSNEPIILTRWQDPTIEELQNEITRLNKIIDELEKWLKERLEKLDLIGDDEIYSGIEYTLSKLKELKEEGK